MKPGRRSNCIRGLFGRRCVTGHPLAPATHPTWSETAAFPDIKFFMCTSDDYQRQLRDKGHVCFEAIITF
jgi:hypothetical protein